METLREQIRKILGNDNLRYCRVYDDKRAGQNGYTRRLKYVRLTATEKQIEEIKKLENVIDAKNVMCKLLGLNSKIEYKAFCVYVC